MAREIGSYQSSLILKDCENHFFDYDYEWFISGRSALDFIIKDIKSRKKIKKAALPSWCCDSMIEPFIRNDFEVIFYPVIFENDQLTKKTDVEADVLLYIDYFGFEHTEQIDFDGVVINDITQSVFSSDKYLGDYCFCSLRKWEGFKTAGLAFADNGFSIINKYQENPDYFKLVEEAMNEKEGYLNYRTDNKEYYKKFVDAEENLSSLYEYTSSKKDILDSKHLDIEYLKRRRKRNAEILLEAIKEYAIFKEVKDNDCPLYVPIIVPEGKKEELRKSLISNDIYCPTHWQKTALHKLDSDEEFIYENELSLICDQRYDEEDMYKFSNCLKAYFKEQFNA